MKPKFTIRDSVIIPDTKENRFSMSSPERDGIGKHWCVVGYIVRDHTITYDLCAEGERCIYVEEQYLEKSQ